jgi:hypothetical protein
MHREQRDTAQRGVAMFHGDSPIGLPNQKAVAQDLARAQALISATVTAAGERSTFMKAPYCIRCTVILFDTAASAIAQLCCYAVICMDWRHYSKCCQGVCAACTVAT